MADFEAEQEMSSKKFILDATAGFRMIWFNQQHPNCVYLDKRPECEPDIIGDYRDLSRFKGETFRLAVFDPSHIIKSSGLHNENITRIYGSLNAETWQSDLKKAFSELWRVLANYGVLLFKWNTFSASSTEVLKLIPHEPLLCQVISNKQKKLNKKSRSRMVRTLWFAFMKIPENQK